MALKFDGSNDDVQVDLDLSSYTDTLNYAFWLKVVTMPTSSVDMVMEISPAANAAGEFNVHLDGTADDFRVAAVSGSPSYNRHDFAKPTVGSWVHIGVCIDLTQVTAADRIGVYYDGVKQTPTATTGAAASTTWDNDTLNIASRNSAQLRTDMEMQDLAFWSGVLDPLLFLEMAKGRSPLGCSPSTLIRYWPMYGTGDPERLGNAGLTIVGATAVEGPLTTQPISAIYPSTVVAAAADVAVSPTAGTLALTGESPTISTLRNISPTAGTLTLTGESPTVSLLLNVSPTAGTLALSGESPSVSLLFNVSPTAGTLALTGESPTTSLLSNVSPTAGALALTGESPTVSLILNVSPTAGTLALTGESPSVDVGKDSLVSTTAGTLALTGESPTVSLLFNVLPTAGTLALTGESPSVQVGTDVLVSPTAGTLALTGESPTISLLLNVSPTAGTLALTGQSPSVSLLRNILPTAGTLALTGESSTVTVESEIAVTPIAGTLALVGESPTISFKYNVAPTAGVLALSGSSVVVDDGSAPLPTPAGGGGGGAGEPAGRHKPESRRRRDWRDDDKPTSETRRNYGPVLEEEEGTPALDTDTDAARLAELQALRDELSSDESRVEALNVSLEDINRQIQVLETKQYLLLLLMVD